MYDLEKYYEAFFFVFFLDKAMEKKEAIIKFYTDLLRATGS